MRLRAGLVRLSLAFAASLLAFSRPSTGQVVTQFPVPTAATRPNGVSAGPDGNVWFTEDTGGKVGRVTLAGVVTEFPVPTSSTLGFITSGPDGNLWFTEVSKSRIGRITPAGVVTEFPIPTATGGPAGIVTGPDGNLWFVEQGGKVGRITTGGAVTEFPIPTSGGRPYRIAAGPDGNLWFTEIAADKIGKITPAGVVTEYPIPTSGGDPLGITAGPDGNVWFIEKFGGKIGRITPSGVITEFPIATSGEALTLGPDGNFWFVEDGGRIGRMTPSGALSHFFIPGGEESSPVDIAPGPDGNLWFTELNGNKIGRITRGCVPGAAVLCLETNRFQVTAGWRSSEASGVGQAVPLTNDSGYFWFFSSGNVELIVKALNACGFNSRFWVFAGGLTNVEVTLTVTDMVTGTFKTYTNPINTPFQPIQDTSAFETCSATPLEAARESSAPMSSDAGEVLRAEGTSAAAACADDATSLCLNNGRFRVTAAWRSAQASGNGFAVKLTGDSGYFWFFSPGNVELIAKALNACGFNSSYWVFAGGLTNVEVTLTVTDTSTGLVRTYVNPLNTAFQPIQDTSAFPSCP